MGMTNAHISSGRRDFWPNDVKQSSYLTKSPSKDIQHQIYSASPPIRPPASQPIQNDPKDLFQDIDPRLLE